MTFALPPSTLIVFGKFKDLVYAKTSSLSAGLAVGLIGGNVFADHGQITGAALEDLFAGATAHGKTSQGVTAR